MRDLRKLQKLAMSDHMRFVKELMLRFVGGRGRQTVSGEQKFTGRMAILP